MKKARKKDPKGKYQLIQTYKYDVGDIDYDSGLIVGWKLNRHFGIFGEGRYLRYFGINSYELKAGLNYTIF